MGEKKRKRAGEAGAPATGGRRRAVLGVAFLGVAAGIGVALWMTARPAPRPPEATLDGADRAVTEAIGAARRRVEASPRSAEVWGDLAMVLLAHDQFPAAGVSFEEAARLDSSDPRWPYLHAATLLKEFAEPARVLALIERAAVLGGDRGFVRMKLGEELLAQGRLDEAEAQFRKALEREPGSARALAGLGRAAHQRGEMKIALAHLSESARRAPHVKATQALLAEVHFRLGDSAAAQISRRAMAGLPDAHIWPDPFQAQVAQRWVGAMSRIEQANDLFQRGNRAEAVALLRRTAKDHPDALLVHLLLGRFLLQMGDAAAAEEPLRQAVKLSPDAFEAHFELGKTLQQANKLPEAAACFRRTIEIKPDFSPAHFQSGHIAIALDRQAEAAEAFQAAVRYRPDFAQAHRDLGQLLAQAGQFAEALIHVESALRLNPEDAKARALMDQVRKGLEK